MPLRLWSAVCCIETRDWRIRWQISPDWVLPRLLAERHHGPWWLWCEQNWLREPVNIGFCTGGTEFDAGQHRTQHIMALLVLQSHRRHRQRAALHPVLHSALQQDEWAHAASCRGFCSCWRGGWHHCVQLDTGTSPPDLWLAPCSANSGSSLAGDFDPEHLGATLLHASKTGEPG